MSAPGVVTADAAAASGRIERAVKVAHRECRHLAGDTLRDRFVIERLDRGIDLGQQIVMRVELTGMRVPSAKLHKEDLPSHVECRAELQQLGDLGKLVPER